MVDAYIAPEMQKAMQAIAAAGGNMQAVDGVKTFPVLNMLNTKYFILPLQGGTTAPIQNPYAQGNGWFVNKLTYVNDANAEYAEVGKIDVRHEAVADKKFEAALGQAKMNDSTAIVKLDKYEPNNLQYTVNSKNGGVVVFVDTCPCGVFTTIGIFLLVDVPCGAFARGTLVVIEEGECLLVSAHLHVGSENLRSCDEEITRGGIGHLRVRLLAIIRYRPLEATAALEHVTRFLATPCLVASDGAETRATHEHAYHIGYLRGVEAIEVEIG